MANKELRTALLRIDGVMQPILGLKEVILAGIQAIDNLERAEKDVVALQATLAQLKTEEPKLREQLAEVQAQVSTEIQGHQKRASVAKTLADETVRQAKERADVATEQALEAEQKTARRIQELSDQVKGEAAKLDTLKQEREKLLAKFAA